MGRKLKFKDEDDIIIQWDSLKVPEKHNIALSTKTKNPKLIDLFINHTCYASAYLNNNKNLLPKELLDRFHKKWKDLVFDWMYDELNINHIDILFIEEHLIKFKPSVVINHKHLSIDFAIENLKHLSILPLLHKYNLSNVQIKKLLKYTGGCSNQKKITIWQKISKFQKLDVAFIEQYKNKIDFYHLYLNKKILKKTRKHFNKDLLTAKLINTLS